MSNYNNHQWQNSGQQQQQQQYGYGYQQHAQQPAAQHSPQQNAQSHGMNNGQPFQQHHHSYQQHVQPQIHGQYQTAQSYHPPPPQQQQYQYQAAQFQMSQQPHYPSPSLRQQQYNVPPQQPQFAQLQQRQLYQQQMQSQHHVSYQHPPPQSQQVHQSQLSQQNLHQPPQLQYPSPHLSSQRHYQSSQLNQQTTPSLSHSPSHPTPNQLPSATPSKPPTPSLPTSREPSTPRTGLKPITNGHAPSEPPEDYCTILLSLSEDFFERAKQSLQNPQDDHSSYFQNMSVGLRCLESVLKKFSNAMSPLLLASTQLQYATILYEETNNDFEAEEVLSAGIATCERNQLIGYQYHMEHLLSRTMFLSNPKAAQKRLDNVIQSAVLRKHYAWVYALRFLRVDLSLRLESAHDKRTALMNLQAIRDLAKSRGDSAIRGLAAIIEAWIYITQRSSETITDAQRTLAVARAQQHAFEDIPQLITAILTLDLICSLEPYEPTQAIEKMKALTSFLEGQSTAGVDHIDIVLRGISSQDESLKGSSGIVNVVDDRVSLHLTWLSMSDISALGYLLWSNASFAKNSSDGHKAEVMLVEGMKLTDDDQIRADTDLMSIAGSRRRWRIILRCYMLAQAAFCQCDRSDWKRAPETLRRLNELLSSPDLDAPHDLHLLSAYLSALTQHNQGNIDAALGIYETLSSDLPSFSSRDGVSLQQTLALLALVQSLFILRSANHPQHYTSQSLLDRLTSFLKDPNSGFVSQNQHIAAVHALLLAIYQPSIDDTINLSTEPTDKQLAILPTKAQLQRCLDSARRVSNSLLLTMCMSYMHFLFYQGIVGEQGIQAARVARFAAKEAGSAMWMAVGDGVLSEVMAWNGFRERSADYWTEGVALAEKLPGKIQERLAQ